MKSCFEIQNCKAVDYLSCTAKMSLKNCWQLKNGCLCRKNPDLKCDDCPIYQAHNGELMDLVRFAQENDKLAVESLIEEYSRFVFQIGKRFFMPGATREDLIQEGMIGLYKAIISYNPEYKTHFEDYASLSIRNRILRAVRMATQLKQKVLSDASSIDEDPYHYSSIFSPFDLEEQVMGKISVGEMFSSLKKILSPMEYEIIKQKITDATVDEMAQKFKLSKKQVENALFRARKKIAVFLVDELSGFGDLSSFIQEAPLVREK